MPSTIKLTMLKFTKVLYKIKTPPKKPEIWECCGDGCPNCVWVTYFKEYEKYQKTNKNRG